MQTRQPMARTIASGLLTFVSLMALCGAVEASTIDQSNYVVDSIFGELQNWNGQTFRPSQDTSAGAGFNLWALGGADSNILTVELWSDVPSNSGATMLAFGNTAFSLTAGQQSMIDVFWPSVSVTPGAQYFIAAYAPLTGQPTIYTTYSGGNLYPSGQALYNYSTIDTATWNQDGWPTLDFTFEEFSSSDSSDAPTVPEPASLLLLGSGPWAVVARRRFRSRT